MPIIAAPDQAVRVTDQSQHGDRALAGGLKGLRGGMRLSECGSEGWTQRWIQSYW